MLRLLLHLWLILSLVLNGAGAAPHQPQTKATMPANCHAQHLAATAADQESHACCQQQECRCTGVVPPAAFMSASVQIAQPRQNAPSVAVLRPPLVRCAHPPFRPPAVLLATLRR